MKTDPVTKWLGAQVRILMKQVSALEDKLSASLVPNSSHFAWNVHAPVFVPWAPLHETMGKSNQITVIDEKAHLSLDEDVRLMQETTRGATTILAESVEVPTGMEDSVEMPVDVGKDVELPVVVEENVEMPVVVGENVAGMEGINLKGLAEEDLAASRKADMSSEHNFENKYRRDWDCPCPLCKFTPTVPQHQFESSTCGVDEPATNTEHNFETLKPSASDADASDNNKDRIEKKRVYTHGVRIPSVDAHRLLDEIADPSCVPQILDRLPGELATRIDADDFHIECLENFEQLDSDRIGILDPMVLWPFVSDFVHLHLFQITNQEYREFFNLYDVQCYEYVSKDRFSGMVQFMIVTAYLTHCQEEGEPHWRISSGHKTSVSFGAVHTKEYTVS